jgi:hypothetical protein
MIQDDSGQAQSKLSVDCSDACIDLEAVVSGGNAPYNFAWEDGSHNAKRRLCATADTHVRVEVRDTAQMTAEFTLEASSASAELDLQVQGCMQTAGMCHAPAPARCELGDGIALPEELTVDVQGGMIQYYAQGAKLPAGRYRVSYVDGCATFGGKPSDGLEVGWSVNGQNTMPGIWGCYLVDDAGMAFAIPPGTVGSFVGGSEADGGGAYKTYAECVAANCDLPPFDFDYPGGKLGVARDGGGIGSFDDLGGEAEGGRSPTFRLTRLDGCE